MQTNSSLLDPNAFIHRPKFYLVLEVFIDHFKKPGVLYTISGN